ncbi:sulfhydryl oxidase 2 [Anthonomus grandis grandis]|uniref:sulfhydryl oxidase 2 n=1 Tax=Anthonomus grandis grandis TaxID=2921223 RepID=UPI0021664294|nr:sulfhydryl oxidase 2 [Anthonomus grandis grandis]
MKPCSLSYVIYMLFFTVPLIQLSKNASVDIQNRKVYQKYTGDQGLYSHKDDVEILTGENFKSAIMGSNKAWLVEFYNSWCGFCQKFAPSWKDFATDIKGWQDSVIVAAMDCNNEQNFALCRDYEVMSYPTLKYFHENFTEEAKNYGANINRGVTAKDHRQDLVNKAISEQKVGRGKQFPNLLPFNGSTLDGLLHEKPSEAQYVILIVQSPEQYVGAELALDFQRSKKVNVRYAFSNNTALISALPSNLFPIIFAIDEKGHIDTVTTKSNDREGMRAAIRQYLEVKNIPLVLDKEKKSEADVSRNGTDLNDLAKRAKQMGDVVFQMDLESALRYSLKREIGVRKEITGEQLEALKKYIELLSSFFPLGASGKQLFQQIQTVLYSGNVIDGWKIAILVKDAEKPEKNVFSTPQHWLGCKGSSPQYRGYPCSLWTLFHYLTVNVAKSDDNTRGDNPRLVLETMHGYIKNFFGCADCTQHFGEMAKRREIFKKAQTFDEAILWLWEAHNEVNNRLSKDVTEDPEFPKRQFPAKENCPKCYKENGDWDKNEVSADYLKHMYSSINVKYLGADTKLLYQALHGSENASPPHGGFLGLDASIYVLLYLAIFLLIFIIINMFLKRGYRRKMYKYKHDLLGRFDR